MAAKKKQIKLDNRPITIQELKFWLHGILEFQSDNWIPNKDQWEAIKHKIFHLVDSPMNNYPSQTAAVQYTGGVAPDANTTSFLSPINTISGTHSFGQDISEAEIAKRIADIKDGKINSGKINTGASVDASKRFD